MQAHQYTDEHEKLQHVTYTDSKKWNNNISGFIDGNISNQTFTNTCPHTAYLEL